MPAATLTSKGQVTIPQTVRVALGLHAGTRVDFVPVADGFMIVPLRDEAASLKGRFAGRVARPVSCGCTAPAQTNCWRRGRPVEHAPFQLERRDVVAATVRSMKTGKGAKAGFADVLIGPLAAAQGCSRIVSFDKAAVIQVKHAHADEPRDQ